jgi:hypothetical protein
MKKTTKMKIVALLFPGLTIAVLLLFAIGETTGGDWSGLGHLIQALPIAFLIWLGWKHPLPGGILLLVLSFLAAYSLIDVLRGPEGLAPFLIIIAPLFLSGMLLLSAAGLERRAA